jgi:hypothetical protein
VVNSVKIKVIRREIRLPKVLFIGNQHQLATRVSQQLGATYQTTILTDVAFDKVASYKTVLDDVNIIYSFLGPWDVDLALEALCQALDQANPPLKQFIILSTAGIDREMPDNTIYPGIDNTKEYLNQQRYAVKLVDEYEIPYTVLRPVTIVDTDPVGPLQIVDEGHPMEMGQVSVANVAQVAGKIVQNQCFINQSIGLIETERMV